MGTLIALGGTLDPKGQLPPIGGSAYLFLHGNAGLLVDFGVHPRLAELKETPLDIPISFEEIGDLKLPIIPRVEDILEKDETFFLTGYGSRYLPRHSLLKDIDRLYVVGTHGHIDHVGALPYLKRKYPNAEIFMTAPTLTISTSIWNENIRLTRSQRGKLLFDLGDIERLRQSVRVIGSREHFAAGPFDIHLVPAGHIPGAVSILAYVKLPNPLKVFFSGDMSFKHQRTVPGASLREIEALGHVDYVVTESTYAGITTVERHTIEETLVADVESCLASGGKALFGALSVGRSQEILAILDAHGITRRYPVYLDGSAREITRIYHSHEALPADMPITFVADAEHRDEIAAAIGPLVMISPGGMFQGGPVLEYLMRWAPNPENLIIITSYQKRLTPGSRLMRVNPGERMVLGDTEFECNAKVRVYPLSAHLDGPELTAMLETLRPERAFLVHGEEDKMTRLISDIGPWVSKTYLERRYDL